ncbi:MAG TPA: TetR/AcrR family transcriptional regulator [Actinomycetota bacterium]|nr:TetR/AcrR family transcriptional regulator [Actinomycetota bacterium]
MSTTGRAARAAATRVRILDAARRVLADEGLERFTTRRVAALAGVSHGMVHYHFTDKRELALALLVHARLDWIAPLEELVDGPGTADERIRDVIAWIAEPTTIETMRVHQSLFVLALHDDAVRERLAAEFARWREPFVTLFAQLASERGLEGFDARSVGEAFAVAADALVQQQALDPRVPTGTVLTRTFHYLMPAGRDGRAPQAPPRKRR